MKAYIQILCLLGVTSLYALDVQQETHIIQRTLVSGHNLAFGQNDIFRNTSDIALTDWNNTVQRKVFACIKQYGTPEQQSAMGVCLAANIDLIDLIKKTQALIDKTKNIQEALAGEVTVILAMIKTLEALEAKQAKQKKTPTQTLLEHLIVMLEVTLKKTLKDLTAL